MSCICLCHLCNGKKVSRPTWDKHSVYLTQKPVISKIRRRKRRKDNLEIEHELREASFDIQDTTISPSSTFDNGEGSSRNNYEQHLSYSTFDNGEGSSRNYEQYLSDYSFEINDEIDTDNAAQLGLRDDISITSSDDDEPLPDTQGSTLDENTVMQWIIMWLLLFQHVMRLPKTATELLLDFFANVLTCLDQSRFSTFPTSNHLAIKLLAADTGFKKFIVCPKCHHLFDPTEYPNGASQAFCSITTCGEALKKATRTSKGKILYKVIIIVPNYFDLLYEFSYLLNRLYGFFHMHQ